MTQSTVQRITRTAVGMPVHAAKTLLDRLADKRSTVAASARRIASARPDIDGWAREGEEFVGRMLRLVRRDAPRAAATARDTVQGLAATAASPVNDVSEIPGVGEAYAARMRAEGVTTVAAFLTRTADDDSLQRFASATGIAAGRLENWRSRVDLRAIDGVDEAHESVLRRAGFGTLASVASAKPGELSKRIAASEPDRMPSRDTLEGWIRSAARVDR